MKDSKCRILIAAPLPQEQVSRIERSNSRLDVMCERDLLPTPRYTADRVGQPMNWTDDMERRWLELLQNAEVLVGFDKRHMQELPDLAPNLRWIQGTSTGIGPVVAKHSWVERGITVTSARGIHSVPLAEFHIMSMLAFSKDVERLFATKEQKIFERYCTGQLRGKTLGVIGLGANGREIARLAHAHGMKVLGIKRNWEPRSRWGFYGVDCLYPIEEMHEMLGASDFVSVVVPGTPETEGMIDAEALKAVKPGAILINTSRGTVIDEEALIEALRDGVLGGASLDVFQVEPLPPESPLWEMDNVLISPHSASCAESEDEKFTDLFIANLLRYLDDQPLLNVIDPEIQY